MKRKEEIVNQAAKEQSQLYQPPEWRAGFISGANWADKTMLDRACEWLNDTDFDMEYWNQENGFCKEDFITAFRQAMEGGAE